LLQAPQGSTWLALEALLHLLAKLRRSALVGAAAYPLAAQEAACQRARPLAPLLPVWLPLFLQRRIRRLLLTPPLSAAWLLVVPAAGRARSSSRSTIRLEAQTAALATRGLGAARGAALVPCLLRPPLSPCKPRALQRCSTRGAWLPRRPLQWQQCLWPDLRQQAAAAALA